MNKLSYYVRTLQRDSIALSVAFTGIAAQLLQGGRTFNARFKFPLKADNMTTWSISKGTGLATLIQKAKLIVWDEAPMSNKILLETLELVGVQDRPWLPVAMAEELLCLVSLLGGWITHAFEQAVLGELLLHQPAMRWQV